jgi:hypothetical protein
MGAEDRHRELIGLDASSAQSPQMDPRSRNSSGGYRRLTHFARPRRLIVTAVGAETFGLSAEDSRECTTHAARWVEEENSEFDLGGYSAHSDYRSQSSAVRSFRAVRKRPD